MANLVHCCSSTFPKRLNSLQLAPDREWAPLHLRCSHHCEAGHCASAPGWEGDICFFPPSCCSAPENFLLQSHRLHCPEGHINSPKDVSVDHFWNPDMPQPILEKSSWRDAFLDQVWYFGQGGCKVCGDSVQWQDRIEIKLRFVLLNLFLLFGFSFPIIEDKLSKNLYRTNIWMGKYLSTFYCQVINLTIDSHSIRGKSHIDIGTHTCTCARAHVCAHTHTEGERQKRERGREGGMQQHIEIENRHRHNIYRHTETCPPHTYCVSL